jgi:putative ABC transport system substrate-binding protein
MRRRDFVGVLGAAAVLCSTRSRAQQPSKTYLIGVLTAQNPSLIKALKDGLRKLGYIEGQNLKVEYRYLLTGGASAETLAAELVRLGPNIIITLGTAEAIAAIQTTTTIPYRNVHCRSARHGYRHERRASRR